MDRVHRALREFLRGLPVPLRHALIGAVTSGVLGGVVGLILGLRAYAPTAWFAVLEVGMPAALLGAVLGVTVGSVVWVYHHARGT
jgi:hypothetical protein